LAGQRVEVRIGDREVTAIALDTGQLACRHPRSSAKHRAITALEHAQALKRRCDGNDQLDRPSKRGRCPSMTP
jgi:hypothetical protein